MQSASIGDFQVRCPNGQEPLRSARQNDALVGCIEDQQCAVGSKCQRVNGEFGSGEASPSPLQPSGSLRFARLGLCCLVAAVCPPTFHVDTNYTSCDPKQSVVCGGDPASVCLHSAPLERFVCCRRGARPTARTEISECPAVMVRDGGRTCSVSTICAPPAVCIRRNFEVCRRVGVLRARKKRLVRCAPSAAFLERRNLLSTSPQLTNQFFNALVPLLCRARDRRRHASCSRMSVRRRTASRHDAQRRRRRHSPVQRAVGVSAAAQMPAERNERHQLSYLLHRIGDTKADRVSASTSRTIGRRPTIVVRRHAVSKRLHLLEARSRLLSECRLPSSSASRRARVFVCVLFLSVASFSELSCGVPHSVGVTCEKARPSQRWYFDSASGDCVRYRYLGCTPSAKSVSAAAHRAARLVSLAARSPITPRASDCVCDESAKVSPRLARFHT